MGWADVAPQQNQRIGPAPRALSDVADGASFFEGVADRKIHQTRRSKPLTRCSALISRAYHRIHDGQLNGAINDGTKVVINIRMAAVKRKQILLVEDDDALAQLYGGVLRMSGFDATHVDDGLAALNFLENESPDLIVVDMNLPVLQGDELLREIGARPDLRHIPAIVVTGADIQLDPAVERPKQILRKPCPPDRLVSVVERYVRAA